MTVICAECGQNLEGDAKVISGEAFHPKCWQAADMREQGFAFRCPVCKGNPRKYHEAWQEDLTKAEGFGMGGEGGPGDTRSYLRFHPARWEVCEQCHGRGYVKKEPRLVPTGHKWETE